MPTATALAIDLAAFTPTQLHLPEALPRPVRPSGPRRPRLELVLAAVLVPILVCVALIGRGSAHPTTVQVAAASLSSPPDPRVSSANAEAVAPLPVFIAGGGDEAGVAAPSAAPHVVAVPVNSIASSKATAVPVKRAKGRPGFLKSRD